MVKFEDKGHERELMLMEKIGEDGCSCSSTAHEHGSQTVNEKNYDADCPHHGERAETWCHRCGGDNIPWSAPSPLWNRIMRGDKMGGKEPWEGIICPTCFAVLAEQEGVAKQWLLHPQVVLADLRLVAPDGRVWNSDTWRWEAASAPFSPGSKGMEHWPEGA